MLTPTVLNAVLPFFAVGNTPAVSVTRGVPQGVDADILLLESGDVRHILYSAYHEKGFPTRKLDLTFCDIEDAIIARNLLILTLLVAQGKDVEPQLVWNVYYHLLLDEQSAEILLAHLTHLLAASNSLKDWKTSEFGGKFRFSNNSTLRSVRDMWAAYAESLGKKDRSQYRADFETALQHSKDNKDAIFGRQGLVYGGARAAAPLGMQALASEELRVALDSWWEKGTTSAVPANANIPNPLFAVSLSEYSVLAHGGDPILGYHLATANAHLTAKSPLRHLHDNPSSAIVRAAQDQFTEWSQAFVDMTRKNVVLRFVSADALSFCHTLQHHLETDQASGHFYRRQLTMESLELDADEYGSESTTPKQFDIIDTSDLSDYLGALNVLVSGSPLLKPVPWATLYTETMQKGTEGEKAAFEELLCAPTRTISTLLGLSPVEYWTNATAVSNVDDYLLAIYASQKPSQKPGIQWRFAWKFHESLSGQAVHPRIKVKDDALATLLHNVYRAMFASEDMMSLMSLSRDQQTTLLQKQACPKYHRRGSSAPLFSKWSNIPEAVAVTIAIPPVAWKEIAKIALEASVGFTVEGSLRGVQGGAPTWHNLFADVQVTFGSVLTAGHREDEGFTVSVQEDPRSWSGDSHMIATFSVPTAALQVDPKHTKVSLCLANSAQNVAVFNTRLQLGNPMLGTPMIIYETDLDNSSHVHITKNQPGQDSYPLYNNLKLQTTEDAASDSKYYFTADIEPSGVIASITGHLDVLSLDGKELLSNKAAVDVRKISPFTFEIVLGEREAVYQLCFPVPVVKDGSKTRIARTSGYVEVTATLADPATAQTLDDFVFPTTMAKSTSIMDLGQSIPVTLNVPHINLDSLPVLDISDKKSLGFLTTLASWTFSVRERKLRDEANNSGISTSARMNFKESLFTMFMLASGLQGGQTGLFAIHHPEKGGIHMLLFVSAIRLDGANGSVALDAAVIPFTVEIIKGGKMEPFLLMLRELECCTITVDDEELVLWKKVLPALVERCRNWTHTLDCEYAKPGATVPLNTEAGKEVLCGCGAGQLPENFINLPEWGTAVQFATRLAISPTYAVPFVEEVIDPNMTESLSQSALGIQGDQTLRCRNCGNLEARGGGALKKCMRCLKVKYCSAECQKKDWKKHRMECAEVGAK
ncbi:hypothetical protein J7T55_005873 [Diaporthe amygdali]|uniref:uncharacterized protein n=1 Tax=Phomopsis amygdali TaxID=1214568 RepID=UPI0022FE79BF|nr:uncharacterized protein J7T55_005873 [Diaporthe amygdali]KAJ0124535.1 hypothetical protein J7T55_005873 [Diaporthe amygdali]